MRHSGSPCPPLLMHTSVWVPLLMPLSVRGSVCFVPLKALYFRNINRMGLSSNPLIRELIGFSIVYLSIATHPKINFYNPGTPFQNKNGAAIKQIPNADPAITCNLNTNSLSSFVPHFKSNSTKLLLPKHTF